MDTPPPSLCFSIRAVTMDTVISLLVFSTIVQHVAPQVTSMTSFRAVLERTSGDSRIFSGEGARLRCSIPDAKNSTWSYQWFKGSKLLAQNLEQFVLWNTRVRDGGKFYCQGKRDTALEDIRTILSLPVEIIVDGGWAILQVPPQPGLVGGTLKVTCRVRDNPPLHEVILYKDGVEVMRQKGLDPNFYLTNLTLDDQGMYSCRASWLANRGTRSVISVATPLQILEVLSQPNLEIVADSNLIQREMMKLTCHVQYKAPAPAPPLHYYFYKDNNRLGIATSENHDLIRRTPGQYSCKVRVPQLGLSRWSEPKSYEQVKGQPEMIPPILHPTAPRPLPRSVSSPDIPPPPAAEPTAAGPSLHRSTAAPPFSQPADTSTRSSDPQLEPSQPAPSTLLSPVQSVNQTTQETDDMSGESGDMSGESGDMSSDTLPY